MLRRPQSKSSTALYLCSINVSAGSLSPGNGTLQLQDSGGGGDDDDDESGDGDEAGDHSVPQHVKDPGVVQIELCGHQLVHRGVGLRVDG